MNLNRNTNLPFKLIRSGFTYGAKYPICNPKKLPNNLSYLAKATVTYLKLLGNDTVSFRFKGDDKKFIPLEALLGYEDYHMNKPTVYDTLFIVIKKNDVFPVGTIFETSVANIDGLVAFYDSKNVLRKLSHTVLCALHKPVDMSQLSSTLGQKYKVKTEAPQSVVKQAEEVPVSVAVVEPTPVVEEAPVVVEVVKSVDLQPKEADIPFFDKFNNPASHYVSFNLKAYEQVVPTVNTRLATIEGEFLDMKGLVHSTLLDCLHANKKYIEGEFYDMAGRKHSTVQSCISANQYLTDVAYLEHVVDVARTELETR